MNLSNPEKSQTRKITQNMIQEKAKPISDDERQGRAHEGGHYWEGV